MAASSSQSAEVVAPTRVCGFTTDSPTAGWLSRSPSCSSSNCKRASGGADVVYCIGPALVVHSTRSNRQSLLLGHDEVIRCVDTTPSGKLCATGQEGSRATANLSAQVIIWDMSKNEERWRCVAHTSGVRSVAFSPDERFVASVGDDAALVVWDCESGAAVCTADVGQHCNDIAWQLTGSTPNTVYGILSVHGDGQVILHTLKFNVHSLSFTLESSTFQMPNSFSRHYSAAAIDVDGDYAYVGSDSCDVSIFRLSTLTFRECIQVATSSVSAIVSSPGAFIVATRDGSVMNFSGEDQSWSLDGEAKLDSGVASLSLSGDGSKCLALAGAGHLYTVSLSSYSESLLLSGPAGTVAAVEFSNGGDIYCTLQRNGKAHFWEEGSFRLLAMIPGPLNRSLPAEGTCLAVSPNDVFYAGFVGGTIRGYNTSGETVFETNAHREGTSCVAVCSDGTVVSGGWDGIIRFWTPDGLCTQQTQEHSAQIYSFVVDDGIIHSVGDDMAVVSVDSVTGKRVHQFISETTHFCCMAQQSKSNGGELIVGCRDGLIREYDVVTSSPVNEYGEPCGERAAVRWVSVSPDGTKVAVASEDKTVTVWDGSSRRLLGRGLLHSAAVTYVAWGPRSDKLITAGEDGAVALWRIR